MYIEEYDENDVITDEQIMLVIQQMPHLAIVNKYFIERIECMNAIM